MKKTILRALISEISSVTLYLLVTYVNPQFTHPMIPFITAAAHFMFTVHIPFCLLLPIIKLGKRSKLAVAPLTYIALAAIFVLSLKGNAACMKITDFLIPITPFLAFLIPIFNHKKRNYKIGSVYIQNRKNESIADRDRAKINTIGSVKRDDFKTLEENYKEVEKSERSRLSPRERSRAEAKENAEIDKKVLKAEARLARK